MRLPPRPTTTTAASTIAALTCGLALTACGKSTIVPAGAARSVADAVSSKTGFRPTDVRCPSGVDAKVGGSFKCQFTGPDHRPYTATMKIVSVHGTNVVFDVSSVPSS